MGLRLGCVADDLTGGTDLALALSRGGARVAQIFGGADDAEPPQAVDAVVISLKVRTAPENDAVDAVLRAANVLRDWGAQQFFFKYCSTFDSTARGNIGPVAEAMAASLDAGAVPFVPSFPANRRTVYKGHLFVGDSLLSRSSMRDHPLTPMTESDLRVHLARQCKNNSVGLVDLETVNEGPAAVAAAMSRLLEAGTRFSIVDAISTEHLDTIANACAPLKFVTGGSAFGESLARVNAAVEGEYSNRLDMRVPKADGVVAILSGSCSAASLEQASRASKTFPSFQLNAAMTTNPEAAGRKVADEAAQLNAAAVVISSTEQPEAVQDAQATHGRAALGDAFERLHGEIARALHRRGVRTFIVAGGETSGAVAAALELKALEVGREIAPGVPWMFDMQADGVSIAFKSGNFGGPDFYADALATLQS